MYQVKQQERQICSTVLRRIRIGENWNFNLQKYTHITSSEQGTVRLRHVHVVVVILELQMKTKNTMSLLVSR